MNNLKIRDVKIEDLSQINKIINFYIANTNISLMLKTQTLEDTENWYEEHGDIYPILVMEDENSIIGYASLSKFRIPEGYYKTAEVSIYIKPEHKNKGLGALLFEKLLQKAKAMDFHNLISIVISENTTSIKFHEKYGFVQVGTIKEAGYKNNKFIDVVYMSKII